MKKKEDINTNINGKITIHMPYIIITLLAIVFFIAIYGIRVLDFQNVDWLYGRYEVKENCFYGNDLTQHYLGWICYRQSDWTFPIGNMDRFSYPYQTSVIYTDSIPLFALFFKLLSPILPEQFQYFGLWSILCFILQGVMAVRLFRSYTDNPVKQILLAAFFVIVPMLLWRTFIHSALCAHWLILMAMDPLVSKKSWDRKRVTFWYIIIGFLTSMTAVYLLLFCGIVLLGTCLRDVLETKKATNSICWIVFFVGSAAITIALLGGFSGDFQSNLEGLGAFSMNLNSLFDSYGFSIFLGELSRYGKGGDRQFEGFGYLGVGFIILLVVAFCHIIGNRSFVVTKIKRNKSIICGIFFTIIISLIFALSPDISLNDKLLIKIPFPEFIKTLWSIFRATGRGVWIVVYLIMFAVGCVIIDIKKEKISYFVLGACLCIQLIDGIKMYNTIYAYFHNPIAIYYEYDILSRSQDFWEEVADNKQIENIILATTFTPYDDETHYYLDNVYDSEIGPMPEELMGCQYMLGDFAVKNEKTFNYFRFSRHPYERSREYVIERLKNPKENDLFIFTDYNKFQGLASGLNMYAVDGLFVGYIGELNEEYKINDEDAARVYFLDTTSDLDTLGNDYYSIVPGEKLLCYSMELPHGIYRFSIKNSDSMSLEFSLSGDVDDNASLLWFDNSEDIATYYVYIEQDAYASCLVLSNIGTEVVDVELVAVEYIGSEDLLDQ